MRTEQLVQAAMTASNSESVRAFAQLVGVSHVAVGKWLHGESVPTFEQAAELAAMAGLPPVATAAQVRMLSPDAGRHRAILKRLALATMPIMSSGRAWYRRAVTLLARLLPAPSEIPQGA